MKMWSIALLAAAAVAFTPGHARAQKADGKALYLKNCRTCHGATGEPSKANLAKYPKIKTLADPEFYKSRSDDSLLVVIKHGVGSGKDMKPFESKLTEAEMLAIIEYMHTLSARAKK